MPEVTVSPNSAPDFLARTTLLDDYGGWYICSEGEFFINFREYCYFWMVLKSYYWPGKKLIARDLLHIYTAQHPLDADERDAYECQCLPVTIGERCWIGGHATICGR